MQHYIAETPHFTQRVVTLTMMVSSTLNWKTRQIVWRTTTRVDRSAREEEKCATHLNTTSEVLLTLLLLYVSYLIAVADRANVPHLPLPHLPFSVDTCGVVQSSAQLSCEPRICSPCVSVWRWWMSSYTNTNTLAYTHLRTPSLCYATYDYIATRRLAVVVAGRWCSQCCDVMWVQVGKVLTAASCLVYNTTLTTTRSILHTHSHTLQRTRVCAHKQCAA